MKQNNKPVLQQTGTVLALQNVPFASSSRNKSPGHHFSSEWNIFKPNIRWPRWWKTPLVTACRDFALTWQVPVTHVLFFLVLSGAVILQMFLTVVPCFERCLLPESWLPSSYHTLTHPHSAQWPQVKMEITYLVQQHLFLLGHTLVVNAQETGMDRAACKTQSCFSCKSQIGLGGAIEASPETAPHSNVRCWGRKRMLSSEKLGN